MNRRDEQIAVINSNVTDLRTDRLDLFRSTILKGYKESSVIEEFAIVVSLTDREPSEFHVLTNSEARPIEQFNGDSYHWDFFCEQLGRSVALAEELHVFERLNELHGDSEPIDASNPSFSAIERAVEELRRKGFVPDTLIAPISLYMPFFKRMNIDRLTGDYVILSDETRLKLHWGGRATPIDRFVILDRSSGEWRVKLDAVTGERLTIAIGRPTSPPAAVTILAETVIDYDVVNREAVHIVEVAGIPPERYSLDAPYVEEDN